MHTLVGSQALVLYCPEIRGDSDQDWFSNEIESSKDVDVFYDPRLEQWQWGPVATLDELYTIKLSHIYWNIHGTWGKHYGHLKYMHSKGAVVIPELHDLLYDVWKDLHGGKHVKLTEDNFFTDTVTRTYPHDDIHEAIKTLETPAYKLILRDGHKVKVDRHKFDTLPYTHQLLCAQEEIEVLALERFLIPHDFEYNKMRAHRESLQKVLTSTTTGWFAKFIAFNHYMLNTPGDYVERFKQNVAI